MDVWILRVLDIRPGATDTATILLERVDGRPLSYQAGQFLTLLVHIHDRELRRSYSFSTTPGIDPVAAITVKRVPNGEVSRYLLDHLRMGDILHTLPPAGRFTLDETAHSLVFIAAGSGMTPVFSLLKKALYEEPLSQVHLLSQDRDEDGILFKRPLEELEERFPRTFHWSAFLSRPRDHRADSRRITNGMIERWVSARLASVPPAERPAILFFLCGPLPFMRMAQFTLRVMGFGEGQIKKEHFTVDSIPGPPLLADSGPKRVTIHYRRQTFILPVVYPDSILTAALRAGIPLPYSCRGGRCSTCMAKCLKGRVKMSINEVLSEKDLQEGWVLTCVGYAETDVEIAFGG